MTPSEVVPTHWTTADYALIISLFSATLSLVGFVWNVWSKFIFPKPRVKVSFSFCAIDRSAGGICFYHYPSLPKTSTIPELELLAMNLKAVNLGPGKVRLSSPVFSSGGHSAMKREGLHLIAAYSAYPKDVNSAAFQPTCLDGPIDGSEEISIYFPVTKEILSSIGPFRAGFRDTFGRLHMCPRREVQHFKKIIRLLRSSGIEFP